MPTIKGPITFGPGPIPDKLKQEIKKNGMKFPIDITKGFNYSNVELDSWLRVKKNGKKYKYNRKDKKWKEDKD